MSKFQYSTKESLGVEALDSLIGINAGATLHHSVILLDENNTNGRYSISIQKCFIAEGIEQDQKIFCAGPVLARIIDTLQKLPKKSEEKQHHNYIENNDDFKIAWRYKTTQATPMAGPANNIYETKYDLSKTISYDYKSSDRVFIFNGNASDEPSLKQLWQEIHYHITTTEHKAKTLRISLNDLSHAFWKDLNQLPLFMAMLKSFSRHANVMVLITLDSTLLDPKLYQRCLPYADAIFQMQKMDEKKQAELHLHHRIDGGRFFVHKLPTISSAAPAHLPHSIDLLFSLRRTFFELKLLHLPPAIGNSEGKEQPKIVKSACHSFVDQF